MEQRDYARFKHFGHEQLQIFIAKQQLRFHWIVSDSSNFSMLFRILSNHPPKNPIRAVKDFSDIEAANLV